MEEKKTIDIVIIGAGLTGLTSAFYLTKFGKNVLVLEKESRAGGVINSIKENGFIYETGPNSGVLGSNETVELFGDLKDLCTLETANEKSKKRLIWKGSKWEPLPSGLFRAITTPLFTLKDKFNILLEPFRKKGTEPWETIADLVRRRLGKSFLEYAIDPFISGIYAGDPERIVTKFALPKLYQLENEYGSFIIGSVKKMFNRAQSEKKPSREVFSAFEGLAKLILALVNKIEEENILFNCSDIKIEPDKAHFNISYKINNQEFEITAGKVITTVGGHALPSLLPFIPKSEIDDISSLNYAKVVQVILGFNNWNGFSLDAFGGLVPTVEKRKILGVLYMSSLFKNRAPENGALLSIFMGGIKRPEIYSMTDEAIIRIVENEVIQMMGLSDFKPDLLRIFRYPTAIPQYEASSGKRFERIAEIEKKYPGLILAGNIRDGIGMSDRIKQARTLADTINR